MVEPNFTQLPFQTIETFALKKEKMQVFFQNFDNFVIF